MKCLLALHGQQSYIRGHKAKVKDGKNDSLTALMMIIQYSVYNSKQDDREKKMARIIMLQSSLF